MKQVNTIATTALKRVEIVDRVEYLKEKCHKKSVLHLGCVDYPFLAERIDKGILLHQALMKCSESIYGVDLDGTGIDVMKRLLKTEELCQGDVERLDVCIPNKKFDIILAPEILEHLNNPGLFLRSIGDYMNPNGQLVITVPTAQSIRLFLHALLSREKVHPDHNCYFSPVTLKHLVETNGLKVVEIHPYWCASRAGLASMFDKMIRAIRIISPWVGEGIVLTAETSA